MKINKIVKLKDNKYKIYINGESIITYDNVILDNDILYKQNIDNKLYEKILLDTNFFNIYNKVVKHILKKRRSEKEINLYLKKYELEENKVNRIINKLKELKLIDDIEFCRAYINDKLYLSKCGFRKIKNDLLEHNIPLNIIEEQLNNIDTNILDNRLEKLVLKKINSNKKYSSYSLKQKILNEMINLGYDKNKILEIVERNIKNDTNILNKEFEKNYIKLQKKYSGIELKNRIKQKLLQKSFDMEEINILLKEKIEE